MNLRTAEHETYVSLRQPQQEEAFVVNLERPTVRKKLEISNTPDHGTLFVEITKVEGIEKVNYVPKQELTVAEKDSTIAWAGDAADRMMGFQIDTVMQRDLQLSMTVVVETGAKPVAFNAATLGQYYNQALLISQQLGPQVEQMKKNRQKFRKELPPLEQQLSIATQTIEKMEKLKTQAEKANGAAIHYRVYRTAGNHKIDIIQGSSVPEAAVKAE